VTAWLRGNQWLVQNGFLPRAHAVLADPPYGLAFMGQHWDTMTPVQYQAWVTEWAALLLDFVYPGAVLAVFGGTRTYHRLAAGLEDAGWDVFDSMVWLYGSGFPKSHDVSKTLDREAGAEREAIRPHPNPASSLGNGRTMDGGAAQSGVNLTAPATPDAAHWHGFGTALKPAYEPIVLARAPRGAHTYAALAREYGTGALAIDAARIGITRGVPASHSRTHSTIGIAASPFGRNPEELNPNIGRWPANVLLDDHAAAALDAQSGEPSVTSQRVNQEDEFHGGVHEGYRRPNKSSYTHKLAGQVRQYESDGTQGASRFFYTAKAAAWERSAGLPERCKHPTMKPVQLTEYLARLLLPPELDTPRRLLVPFSGSGSEMIGAALAGWDTVMGIEREAEYAAIAQARLTWWAQFSSYEDARKAYQAARKEARKEEQVESVSAQIPLFAEGEVAR